MGAPKHLLEVGGRTFLEHCVAALSGVVDEVIISVAAGQALPPLAQNVSRVEDRHAEGGPLSGLAATLERADAKRIAVLSCDAPLVKPAVLTLLFDAVESHDAALPIAKGRQQYFPGVYDRRIGASAQRLLEQNEHRMTMLLGECRCVIVPEDQVSAVDPDLDSFLNVNTPEDYETLVRRFKRA